jgi:SAM-dependent methyltransferase
MNTSWFDELRERTGRETRRIVAQARKLVIRARIGQRWQSSDQGFTRRVYPDYETYLSHQRTKLDALRRRSVEVHDRRFYAGLSERLRDLPFPLAGRSVLCLAARQGTEVRAFSDQGAFAVGIDLNPGRGNRYVVVGDFHALQFHDRSVQLVYTNSLDHAFDLERILAEVHRVLADDGHLLAEVGRPEGRGFYESLSWSSVDDLLERMEAGGFALERRGSFDLPWEGDQLLLKKLPR